MFHRTFDLVLRSTKNSFGGYYSLDNLSEKSIHQARASPQYALSFSVVSACCATPPHPATNRVNTRSESNPRVLPLSLSLPLSLFLFAAFFSDLLSTVRQFDLKLNRLNPSLRDHSPTNQRTKFQLINQISRQQHCLTAAGWVMDCFCHCMQPHAGCGLANGFPVFRIFNFSVILQRKQPPLVHRQFPKFAWCLLDSVSWILGWKACPLAPAETGFRMFQMVSGCFRFFAWGTMPWLLQARMLAKFLDWFQSCKIFMGLLPSSPAGGAMRETLASHISLPSPPFKPRFKRSIFKYISFHVCLSVDSLDCMYGYSINIYIYI